MHLPFYSRHDNLVKRCYNTKAEAEFNSKDGAGDCEGHTTHKLMGLENNWILAMLLSPDGNHC